MGLTDTTAPRTAAPDPILDLDYRMVEWWNMEGTSYSLVQVVSRLAAVTAYREAIEPLLALVRAARKPERPDWPVDHEEGE